MRLPAGRKQLAARRFSGSGQVHLILTTFGKISLQRFFEGAYKSLFDTADTLKICPSAMKLVGKIKLGAKAHEVHGVARMPYKRLPFYGVHTEAE